MPSKPLPNYTWDPVKRRYRDKQGHLVRNAVILALILRAVRRSKKTFEQAAQELLDQKITERQFQAIMQHGISAGHMAIAAIAAGGAARLVGALLQATRRIIATQTAYMLRLGAQINLGQVSEAQLLTRAAMYGDALYSTFANIQLEREKLVGKPGGPPAPPDAAEATGSKYAKRTAKNDDASCQPCIDQDELQWQPIDEVLPIGDAQCLVNCRCEIAYKDEITPEEQAAHDKAVEEQAKRQAEQAANPE